MAVAKGRNPAVPPQSRVAMPKNALWTVVMPLVFVVLWSTGFIGARLALPDAQPWTFLGVRFGIVALLFAAWMVLTRANWPSATDWAIQGGIGLLVHVSYLGGVFVSVDLGLEAGTSAIIVGLQPVIIALMAASLLGERLRAIQWLGMALGLGGVVLVVWQKLGAGIGNAEAVAICVGGLLAIAVGSALQKRYSGRMPMLTGNMMQFAISSVACMLLAAIFEDFRIIWSTGVIIAMVWSVVILSIVAITLYYLMIKHGAASEVASLFFLVPVFTALMAWPLFGELMGPLEIFGMTLAAVGVLLVLRKPGAA